MNSITKSSIPAETIEKMAVKAFPQTKVKKVTELTEGFFNAAFLIVMENEEEMILKIAPPADVEIMAYEKDIMQAEADAMKLVADKTAVPIPKVLSYDNSHSIIDSDYFFMNKLAGESLSSIQENLTEEEKASIEFQSGKYNVLLNSLTEVGFGYYNKVQKEKDWFQVFISFLGDIILDAKKINLDIGVDNETLEALLQKHKEYFREVTVPKLVHWDLWAGNIFVKDKKITGLIDFERCIWGDELLEVGFRSHNQNPSFLKGYGKEEFTKAEQVRILWYDLYLFMIASLECDYRKYPDRGMYHWGMEQSEKTLNKLRNC